MQMEESRLGCSSFELIAMMINQAKLVAISGIVRQKGIVGMINDNTSSISKLAHNIARSVPNISMIWASGKPSSVSRSPDRFVKVTDPK